MIGKTLVHYEITAEIGRGGMGEVYQAKDTKLGRDVAIKVLPEEFALDTDRVARFQREAKLLASLNHPNIAAIYGLEESEGMHFLVMELIEGDTLRDRIKSGPIPVEEALKLALQMAEALEAAHEKGVIHRDLKPANIKVTPDGKVKILDFGLAKAYAGDQENLSPMDSPTISAAATQQGVILGTAAYMSPEQARGKPVDRRADIWAFGVVLFEMLTGKTAFSGDDVTDTLAAVIRSEPEWKGLPRNLHWRLREVLERCLEKKARDRYSGIGDARVDIQKVLGDPSGVFAQTVAAAKPHKRFRLGIPWVATTIALTAIIALVIGWNFRPAEPRRVIRFDYELPGNQQFSYPYHNTLAVSPDSTQFVYSTTEGLYLRDENEFDAKFIVGTDERPTFPFFSPDGQWIGYFSRADRQLKKIDLKGGAPEVLCDVHDCTGVSWGVDDMIVYGDYPGPISRIPANGGTPEPIVETEGILSYPQILPDGKTVMFSHWLGNTTQVVMQSVETGERRVSFSGHSARYLPTGHIVYAVENNLLAVPFDLDNLKILAGGVTLIEGISLNPDGVGLDYAVSESGTLAYRPESTSLETRTLVWVDRSGIESPIAAVPPQVYFYPRISPDGERVALDVRGRESDIYIWDFTRGGSLIRFTFDVATENYPVWTPPDGEKIAFVSNRAGKYRIYQKPANNPMSTAELITDDSKMRSGSVAMNGYCFTPDSEFLIFREQDTVDKGDNIGMIALSDSEVTWLLETEYNERNAELSPEADWIAYQSDQSGEYEVYVRPFPNLEYEIKISNSGGQYPLWSRNGDELFYIEPGNPPHMVAVSMINDAPGIPERLFDFQYFTVDMGRTYDVSVDGQRFLVIDNLKTDENANAPIQRINIVVNWFEELKQRVPVD